MTLWFSLQSLTLLPYPILQESLYWDFPGGPVVENLPSNAVDTGLIPGQGTKIPHAAGQLSLCATTTEPMRSGARMPQLESPRATTRKKPVRHQEEPACCKERSLMTRLRPNAAINK